MSDMTPSPLAGIGAITELGDKYLCLFRSLKSFNLLRCSVVFMALFVPMGRVRMPWMRTGILMPTDLLLPLSMFEFFFPLDGPYILCQTKISPQFCYCSFSLRHVWLNNVEFLLWAAEWKRSSCSSSLAKGASSPVGRLQDVSGQEIDWSSFSTLI